MTLSNFSEYSQKYFGRSSNSSGTPEKVLIVFGIGRDFTPLKIEKLLDQRNSSVTRCSLLPSLGTTGSEDLLILNRTA